MYQVDAGDFLLHTSILHSIPKEWKFVLKTENIVTDRKESLFNRLLKAKQVNSFLYNYQLENNIKSDIKSEKKWETEFEGISWGKIYIIPIKSTIDCRLRNFQYKYLLRIIPTNKTL